MEKLRCRHCGRLIPSQDYGDYFQGNPKDEARHFLARAIWSLHKSRQALEAGESRVLSFEISAAIKIVDEVAVLALELTPPTH